MTEKDEITYKRMGDLKVGDVIIGAAGEPTTVTAAYDEHIPKNMYEIEMEDGQVIKASGNHLWYCETDTDRKEKKKYKRAAKKFFKENTLPAYDDLCPAFPPEIMGMKFSNDVKHQKFIERVCQSLGPSIATPHMTFDGYMEVVADEMLFTYSFNDMIDFLKDMEDAISKKGTKYFYFGKVRSSDEIFSIMDENVNIPEKGDVLYGKERRK